MFAGICHEDLRDNLNNSLHAILTECKASNNNAVKLFSLRCRSPFGLRSASVFVYHRSVDSRLFIVSFSVRIGLDEEFKLLLFRFGQFNNFG